MIGLNVGSGQRPFDNTQGWVNIDCIARDGMPKPDLIADGAHLPFPDDYADYVVLHHVLEHFGCGEAKGLIEEAYRVLKPGGSLLVFVPHMYKLVHLWLSAELDTQIFMTNVYGAYMGDEADRHKWGYDERSLREFLSRSGYWSMISSWGQSNWRHVPGADIARDDRWILGMECVK